MFDKIEIKNSVFKDTNLKWLEKNTFFLTIYGSIAYNLNTPESDIDVRGICIPPQNYYFGFQNCFAQFIKKEPDSTIFNINKFFNLTSQGNPNTLELLFVDPKFHILTSEIGQILIDNRKHFLSKQLKERYVGYAKAQAHRIRQHRHWILNPIKSMPTRKEFGLQEKPQIERNQFDAIKSLISKKIESWNPDFEPFSESQKIYIQNNIVDILSEIKISSDDKWAAAARTIGLDDNLIEIIKKEKEYENKIENFKNYKRWLESRNPKRAALEEKFGYDTKHASTLIRLLRVGKEALEVGDINVQRIHDRDELLAIKNGLWNYDFLLNYVDNIEKEVKIAYNNSKLPNQPNIKYLDDLCIKLVEKFFTQNNDN